MNRESLAEPLPIGRPAGQDAFRAALLWGLWTLRAFPLGGRAAACGRPKPSERVRVCAPRTAGNLVRRAEAAKAFFCGSIPPCRSVPSDLVFCLPGPRHLT
ncbi:hypothetical protein B0J18DRAFT_422941 [Chaetomium sp. MPI-SDFR-AT-0129]|nr:hypothetical protein B0J18DRAFT_422941 [Chaetomium sp. MPI-SDFR-AT-0129]